MMTTTASKYLSVENDSIPELLTTHARWLTWALVANSKGTRTKVPDRSTKNLAKLSHFDVVKHVERSREGGIGFVFTDGITDSEGYTLVALDLDACRDPNGGAIAPEVEQIILDCAETFTEVSPSGTGLRVFVLVRELDRKVNATAKQTWSRPAGVTKSPEIQLFGVHGSAQYVTVSGQRLRATSTEIKRIENLSWLFDRFGFGFDYHERKPSDNPPKARGPRSTIDEGVPAGRGPKPTIDEVEATVRGMENGALLITADWQHDNFEYPTASEAFGSLVGKALFAARGHTTVVVDFLLDRTTWGAGLVENSKDPSKYARRSWVTADVNRAARRNAGTLDASRVFSVIGTGSDTHGLSGYKALQTDAQSVGTEPFEQPRIKRTNPILGVQEFRARRAAQRFLIDGILPREGLAQFFGDPGTGKTPVVMSAALAIALGEEKWFEHDVDHQGRVLYLIGEDASGLSCRFEAELKARGLTEDALDGKWFWSGQPGQLCDSQDVARWRDAMRDIGEFAMVVVDTQSRNFGAGNENDTQDMTAFVNNLATLADQMGCLVVLVHHTGHKNKERSRGSSVMFGALDASYEVSRETLPGGQSVVTVRSTKSKNWADPRPLVGTLVPVELGRDHKGRPLTAITLSQKAPDPTAVFEVGDIRKELESDDGLRAVFECIAEAESAGERMSWRKAQAAALRARCQLSDHKAKKALTRLCKIGAVQVVETNRRRGSRYRVLHKTLQGDSFVGGSGQPSNRATVQPPTEAHSEAN